MNTSVTSNWFHEPEPERKKHSGERPKDLRRRHLRILLSNSVLSDDRIHERMHLYPTQQGWEFPEYYLEDDTTTPPKIEQRQATIGEIRRAFHHLEHSFFVDPAIINPRTGGLTITGWPAFTEDQKEDIEFALEEFCALLRNSETSLNDATITPEQRRRSFRIV